RPVSRHPTRHSQDTDPQRSRTPRRPARRRVPLTRDFDELVGDLEPEQRERLRRAHELLLAAGPLPELPPSLADPQSQAEAEIVPFFNRRRTASVALLAAAAAAAAFGI